MIRKLRWNVLVFSLALVALACMSVGCSSKPTDSQLTTQVQKQIGADPALQGQSISVSAKNGAVTLSGTVNGPGSRELASNDAAKVSGVKTVINNLTTAGGPNAGPADQSAEGGAGMPPPPPPPPSRNRGYRRGSAGMPPPPPPSMENQSAQSGAGMTPPPASSAAAAQGQTVVVPAGTRVRVRLNQTLSTRDSQTGDPFYGVLASSVQVNGQVVIPAGAQTRGVVTEAQPLGRFKGQAVLAIRLDGIRSGGQTYMVRTSRVVRVEQGKGKRSAILTGGGAGLGALIGGLTGGGKGALIGGLLGGGGGAAGSAFTGNKDLVLPAESIVTFSLERSLTVTQ